MNETIGLIAVRDVDLPEFKTPERFKYAGTIGKGDRSSKIQWIWPMKEPKLFRYLWERVQELNEQVYHYDITHIPYLQYTVYEVGDYYQQHSDTSILGREGHVPGCQRKISFSITLNTIHEDFEGGILQFMDDPGLYAEETMTGNTMVSFPSYAVHRVTPVEKGMRRALIGWVEGPDWR